MNRQALANEAKQREQTEKLKRKVKAKGKPTTMRSAKPFEKKEKEVIPYTQDEIDKMIYLGSLDLQITEKNNNAD